jgi:hypothetical protein
MRKRRKFAHSEKLRGRAIWGGVFREFDTIREIYEVQRL